MTVNLIPCSRENWLEAISLNVHNDQAGFVPSAAVSLAKVHIKPDGDNVTYLPFCIYHEHTMVGFIMHAFEEDTENMFWINGFFIDVRYQKKGYGQSALFQMINYICSHFPKCKEIRLTVHKNNSTARMLYEKIGFKATGEVWDFEVVMALPIVNGLSKLLKGGYK
ncbi:diamine N-acetyltransferase [Peribacillus deserti]|uniref:Diamine N-acetyltransferase n=1 Tax=Peribacillus deserti TaxID=673318 RepID=A0ABS2QK09_9BACI|nr:GNAT family N-acetyltransferase [Peribacillus deserti]MBM7692828.1 diamine N-acetyltransferase [Peribacillus deserti]